MAGYIKNLIKKLESKKLKKLNAMQIPKTFKRLKGKSSIYISLPDNHFLITKLGFSIWLIHLETRLSVFINDFGAEDRYMISYEELKTFLSRHKPKYVFRARLEGLVTFLSGYWFIFNNNGIEIQY